MVNYNDTDQAVPPLPPVTLSSLSVARMPPYQTFQEGLIPCSPTQSVLEGNTLYGCLPWRTMSAEPVTTPRGNMNTQTLSAAFLGAYRLQSSLQESEIPCGKHFSL